MCRKNYGFWLDALTSYEAITNASAGSIGSAFGLCSGIGKVALAVFVDTHSPSRILAGALAASAVLNLVIFSTLINEAENGAPPSVPLISVLWGLNGIVQSLGWPALARIFLAWFPNPTERGRWYSLLSTNQNLGAALVPLLLTSPMSWWGWKAALYLPGLFGVGVALALFAILEDNPRSSKSSAQVETRETVEKQTKQQPANISAIILEDVIQNPSI